MMSFLSFIFSGLGWIGIAAAFVVAVALWVFGKVMPAWLGPLMIALMAVAFVGSNVSMHNQLQAEKSAHKDTRVKHALITADIANKTAEAERLGRLAAEAAMNKQNELQATIEGIGYAARKEKAEHELRLAAANRLTERVRGQLAEITRTYSGECAKASAAITAAGERPPASCAVGMLADLLGREQRRAAAYAGAADAARKAGLTCERAYDAAREALQSVNQPP